MRIPSDHLSEAPARPGAPSESTAIRAVQPPPQPQPVQEIGGPAGPLDPTRYGDWERNGRCIDF